MVRKAVILAAGRGTRMGPITKSIPKPMLPVLDKPILHYLVDEVMAADIHEIYIVTSYKQEIIQDYFQNDSRVLCVSQPHMNGTAKALQCVEPYLKGESFALLLGDELIDSEESALKQLIHTHEHTNQTCATLLESTTEEKIRMYNQVVGSVNEKGHWLIQAIDEKPHQPISPLTSIGRYVLSPTIFSSLSTLTPRNGEYVLTDALNVLARKDRLIGVSLKGKRFDVGNKKEWLQANLHFSHRHPEYE